MAWIKRNLYFLIGSLVALALMGMAGWYLYSKWQLNTDLLTKLDEAYAELDRLSKQSPHPGSGKVDNIQAAKEEERHLRDFIQQSRKYFQRIPRIPDGVKLTDSSFSSALDTTISQMQRQATNANVSLPSPCSFSFQAQKQSLTFAPGSLDPLSTQLGEVKAVCDVLFRAGVNSLDGLRRERVSPDDANGPQTDYLDEKSATNDLAVLSPYEVTFRCFSSELALVLAGYASSPCGLLVKTINVELASTTATPEQPGGPTPPMLFPPPVQPPVVAPGPPEAETARRYMDRYGARERYGPGVGPAEGGYRSPLRPVAPAPTYYSTATPAPAAPAGRGLPTVLDQKQLKVTIGLEVVKLASPK